MAVRDEDSTTATVPGAARAPRPADDEATAFFQRGAQADVEDGGDEATRVAGGLDLVPDELREGDVLSEPAIADDDVETVIGRRKAAVSMGGPRAPQSPRETLGEVVSARLGAMAGPGAPQTRRMQAVSPQMQAGPRSDVRVWQGHGEMQAVLAPMQAATPQAPTSQQPAPYAPAPPVAAYAQAPAVGPPASAPPLARISAPAPAPVVAPRGAPRVFVLVMSFCGVFTATGLALLAYLKARHLW